MIEIDESQTKRKQISFHSQDHHLRAIFECAIDQKISSYAYIMTFAFRFFKRSHDITINIDTFAETINSSHSLRTSTLSQWSSLTAFNVNTTFSNDTHDRDLWISIFYVQKSNESDYDSESEWTKSLTNEHNLSTKIFLISNNTKLEDMILNQIVIRIFEIFDLNEKKKQIEIIHVVACLKKFLILIARISFDKNLIFNMLSLLHSRNTSIVLMMMFLKFIAKQQYEKINKFSRIRFFIYDKNHKFKLNRQRIAVEMYTHDTKLWIDCQNFCWQWTMFINFEYILSIEFNENICKKSKFRERLIVVIVDELHLIDDWRDFRSEFNELHVLKSRLSSNVSYFDIFVTLNKNTLIVVKRDVDFENCRIIKTSIDKSKINMHIIFIENNQNNFENLRRFFSINATDSYNIFKTILYFDSKSNIQKFVRLVIDVWFLEWNYSFVVKRWIATYHANMIDDDKKRIAHMFEKSNQANFFELDSSIRFLIVNDAYELSANNSNIKNICNWMIFKSKNVMTQRKSRSARQVFSEFCYLLISRWTCNKIDLLKVRKDKENRNSLLKAYILEQNDSEYEFDQNNVVDFQIKSMIKATKSAYNAQQRQKQISTYIDLINFLCNRLCELERYDDEIYVEYKENKLIRFAMCCSFCNSNHISKHRSYFEFKKFDFVFHAYFTKKLTLWKDEKIRKIYANSHIFMFELIILFDRFLRIIIQVVEFLTDRDALLRYCKEWFNRELYQNEIVNMCIDLQNQKRTDSEVYLAWRAAIAAKKKTTTRKKKKLSNEKKIEIERFIRERKKQRDAWLISKSLSIENKKKNIKERKKNVVSTFNVSLTMKSESQSQKTSQSTDSSSFSLFTIEKDESQRSMFESQFSQLASTRSFLFAISDNVNKESRSRANSK